MAKSILKAKRHLVCGLVGELLGLEQDYLYSQAHSAAKQAEVKAAIDECVREIEGGLQRI
jgi:hypothetical protein